jgi:transketolase
MNELHSRILAISKSRGLTHIGSNLTAVNVIDEIYSRKKPDEPFVLSCGHCGLALYVVIEKYRGINAEKILDHHGIHPDRCSECELYCSTGSLGHGIGVALGMAIADRTKNVYCLISDGECFEGTIWEAANAIQKYKVNNLHVYLNFNGWAGNDKVPEWMLDNLITIFPHLHIRRTRVEEYGLSGLSAHYVRI